MFQVSKGATSLAAALWLLAIPAAFAQTNSPTTPPPNNGAAPPPAAPTDTVGTWGNLKQSHNEWRSSQLVGSNVYNSSGDAIGTVSDLLMGNDGKVENVIISVGGFLGIGDKLVEVPYNKLKFESGRPGDTRHPVTTAANRPDDTHTFALVLPGTSKEQLKSMPTFSY